MSHLAALLRSLVKLLALCTAGLMGDCGRRRGDPGGTGVPPLDGGLGASGMEGTERGGVFLGERPVTGVAPGD